MLFLLLTPLRVSSSSPTWQDNLHCCLAHTQHQQTKASSRQLEVTWRQLSHSPGESSNKVALGWELVIVLTTIPSQYRSTFHPSPGSFPAKEVTFHVPGHHRHYRCGSYNAHRPLRGPACCCSAHHHFLCFNACCYCCRCTLLPDCGLAWHTSVPQTFSSHQGASSKRRLKAGKTDQVGGLYGRTDIGLAGGSGGEQDCSP